MNVAYWRERARALGPRAVVSLDHPAADRGAVTAVHRAILLPLLEALLRGDEEAVCDLGCGTGRFTADLARLVGGRAVGIDPVPELLALAVPDAHADFRLLGADGRLPMGDGEADVVTSLVLGGLVARDALAATSAELRRVLRPGGLVFLAESISAGPGPAHWRPRTARLHRGAFAWAALEEVAGFDDAGDPVAVLAGRGPGL